jgi:hypothetical protein
MPNTVQIVPKPPTAVIIINDLMEAAPYPDPPRNRLGDLVTQTWAGMDIRVIAWSEDDECWHMWYRQT